MVRRGIGLGMLAIEAALVQLTMGYLPVSAIIVCTATAGSWPRIQFNWSGRARLLAAGAVVVCFYLILRLDIIGQDPFRTVPLDSPAPLAGAFCAMTIQALVYYWRSPKGLPDYYPALGIIALAFGADHYLSGADLLKAWGYAMLYGLFMALFYAADPAQRRNGAKTWRLRRHVWLAVCLVLAFLLAAGTARALKGSDQFVAQWMSDRALMQRIGLGNNPQSQLDSISNIKGEDFDRIVLQIEAAQTPGYLRGQAYPDYANDTWSAFTPGVNATATDPPEGYQKAWRNEVLYRVQPDAGKLTGAMTIYPDGAIDRALFAPQDTGWVGRTSEGVIVSDAGIIQAPPSLNGEPYRVLLAPPPPASLSGEARVRYTALPEDLAPKLRELSERICGDKTGAQAKASAIAQHFTANYAYVLGIQVPEDTDPMAYFLFSDPPPAAHCEFFATGAALLLRAAGVPARYVTGVGVWEQHPFADYWVARNRDAHAWVEAWDPEEGWFIVEATPASGLPDAAEGQGASMLGDFWSLLKLNIQRLIAAFRDGAWHTILEVLRSMLVGLFLFVQSAWWWLILILGLGMAINRLRGKFRRRSAAELPAGALGRRLHHQLGTMDRLVRRRHRLVRAKHVTVNAFARALEAVDAGKDEAGRLARWYRAWAELRYQVQPDPEKVDGLEEELKALRGRKG